MLGAVKRLHRFYEFFLARFVNRFLLCFFIATVGVLAGPPACHPQPAGSASSSREVVLAFSAGVAALEVLDELHLQRMKYNLEPTEEQVAFENAHHQRLLRLRDALAIARGWLNGDNSEAEGRAAFRDSLATLKLLVEELRAQGVAIPRAVDTGLIALSLLG